MGAGQQLAVECSMLCRRAEQMIHEMQVKFYWVTTLGFMMPSCINRQVTTNFSNTIIQYHGKV